MSSRSISPRTVSEPCAALRRGATERLLVALLAICAIVGLTTRSALAEVTGDQVESSAEPSAETPSTSVDDTLVADIGVDWMKLRAVTNWPNGKTYFFLSDGSYVRYDDASDRLDGAAQPVGRGWSGMAPWQGRILGVTNWRNGKTYFFITGGFYVRYDNKTERVDGTAQPIAKGWPGMAPYASKIVAVTDWPKNGKTYFFLNDGTYVRYDDASDRVDGSAQPVGRGWPGMTPYASKIVAVTDWPRNGKTYFFLNDGTYVRYDNATDRVDGPAGPTVAAWGGAVGPPPRPLSQMSYERGIGSIPDSCPGREEFEAGVCYAACPSGYLGALATCWKQCPSGYPELGAVCGKPNPFVVCPSGFAEMGLTCGRPSQTRSIAGAAQSCASDEENQLGLCYDRCDRDFVGVGPVCFRELDPAALERRARELEQRYRRIESQVRPYVDVATRHLERVLFVTPNLNSLAISAYERGDINEIGRLIRIDALRADLEAVASETKVAGQSAVGDGGVAESARPDPLEAAEEALLAGRVPVAPMPTSDESLESAAQNGGRDADGTNVDLAGPGQVTPFSDGTTGFKAITFAPLVADASLIVGGTVERGHAWPRKKGGLRYSYTSDALSGGVTAGVDLSMAVGFWMAEPKDLAGVGHGVTMAATMGLGLSISIWFTYDGEFSGFQIMPQAGEGLEVEYTRGETLNVSAANGFDGKPGTGWSEADRRALLEKFGVPIPEGGGS